MRNTLFFGDNLDILRRGYIAPESVDLIYLDPPFNSNATYNVLFGDHDTQSAAQIKAFDDTWAWNTETAAALDDVLQMGGPPANAMRAFETLLGHGGMLAYLSMMAPRLVELRRTLKPTGSLYLHCDPTASHYLKVLLDAVFGPENYRNEIVWQRTNAHNMRTTTSGRVQDTILFYTYGDRFTFNHQYSEYGEAQLKRYRVEETSGRYFTGQDLTMMGTSADRQFEWRGTKPPSNRVWGMAQDKLEELWEAGLILTKADGSPRLDGRKVYLDERPGKVVASVWTDIPRVGNTAAERLGYPTQKPEALLERIISASSNPGDLVLDPFCGCGTTVAAAQELDRPLKAVQRAFDDKVNSGQAQLRGIGRFSNDPRVRGITRAQRFRIGLRGAGGGGVGPGDICVID
jgi:site-specific DNA-methyltransferase (adenine-specific)